MIKHIIFDCFGTLIDTGNGSIKAVEQILSNVGSDMDAQVFYSDWKKCKKRMMNESVFRNEKTLFELSLAETFHKYGIRANASVEVEPMILSLFSERIAFPDVNETLLHLTEQGIDYVIGSTTDTDSLIHYLKSNDLRCSHIFTSEDMRVYKPHPDFYRRILSETGWSVEECLFVGDSFVDDVFGPKSVGMKAALLDWKGTYEGVDLEPAPDYVIRSLRELVGLLS